MKSGRGIVNKIINKKTIIATMVMLIIAILSGIGVTTNYNKGIQTSLNKADLNTNYDPSGMGIDPNQVVKTAINLTNNTEATYANGCIGFINSTISAIQSNNDLKTSCDVWNNSTINGISADRAKYASTSSNAGGSPWFTVLGMDANSLKPGDIIIGAGHAMVYLGQANSYEELNTNLQSKYGASFSGLLNGFVNTGDTASYYKDYLNTSGHQGVGSTYWTVDVNGNGKHARVENYDWSSTETDAGSKNLNQMRVYRFKKNITGQYHLNIAKRSIEDNSALANKTGINGVNIKVTNTTNNKTGTHTTGKISDNCYGMIENFFGNTTITKDNVNTPDVYTLEETNTVDGYEKIDLSNIRIAVYKKVSSDNSKYIVDYVRINDAKGNEIARATNNENSTNGECTADINGDGLYDIGLEVYGDGSGLCVTIRNKVEKLSGSFKLDVVKYIKGTTKKLGGAGFKVVVNNGTKDIYKSTKDEYTKDDGILEIKNLPIEKENITYKITITETVEPKGYIGLSGPITFTAKSKLKDDKKGYELVAAKPTVANAKKVEVKANEILVETENTKTRIDIHKGVKTVENQDSGYYYDEKTGKEYTEEDLEKLEHKWVVETTIPQEVEDYTKYIVNDPIDESKLEFSGLEKVLVQTIDKSGKVVETLTKDKDYKAEYKNGSLSITYINGNFKGEFLKKTGIQNLKVRVTFNTTFKVNENGKLAVLDGVVTNAQNRARLTYNIGSGYDINKYSENPEVHTGAVSVFKYEDTNGNGKHDEGEKALVGAEFKIALTEEDAKAGNFVKIGGKELTAVSNEDGIATFTGLSFGGDAKDDEANLKNGLYRYDWETASRDYYIVETVTPAGYEKLTDVVKVTVSKNSSEIIDLTEKINEMESVGNRPLIFDLALRKWVTQAIVIEDGKTVVTETGHKAEDDPEAVVKVDLKKKKLNDVVVKFKYSIRITNEGEVDGEAQEISDYIPKGLKFVKEDNPDWEEVDGKVVTDKLKGVTLKHGESAEVEIILTWINSEENMGVMVNTAEISKDYNEYGYDDIDSTPNNKKDGEDDIDDAPVMLAVKTGSEVVTYVGIAVGMIVIISLGVCLIKKSFKEI